MPDTSMSSGEVGSTVMAAVDEFVQQLRRRQIQGSTATAKRTAEILRLLVTKSRRPTPEGMLNDVCFVGMRMQAAKPLGAPSSASRDSRKSRALCKRINRLCVLPVLVTRKRNA